MLHYPSLQLRKEVIMVKADWVSVAASIYRAVTDPTKTPPIYQVQCVHSGASCIYGEIMISSYRYFQYNNQEKSE